jgi:tRNA(fMet)-specific endonuclease VapC
MYLLDTNIISYLNSKEDPIKSENIKINLAKKYESSGGNLELYYSVICFQETLFGVENAKILKVEKNTIEFYKGQADFVKTNCLILDYTPEMAVTFAKIKAHLIKRQKLLNKEKIEARNYDIMIAATAIECGFTLITNNTKHFQNIPGLEYEDWTVI